MQGVRDHTFASCRDTRSIAGSPRGWLAASCASLFLALEIRRFRLRLCPGYLLQAARGGMGQGNGAWRRTAVVQMESTWNRFRQIAFGDFTSAGITRGSTY